MMRGFQQLAGGLILAGLLTGCTSVLVQSGHLQPDGKTAAALDVSNPLLFSRISVKDARMMKEDDRLRVQVTLHNRWHFNLDYAYQFQWFDANGMEIAPGARPWVPIVLHGKADITAEALAPSAAAVAFKLRVRD